jgi:hypothetical protein
MKIISLLLKLLLIAAIASAQNTLKITSGATLDLNGGIALTLKDISLDNDGTLSPAVGAGSVFFTGSANSFIRGTGTTNFDELWLVKSANNLLLMQTDFNIRSGIWLSAGSINLNNHVISLLGNSALHGESETSRILSTGGGYVEVNIQMNAPDNMNPGNLGAIITSKNNLGLTTIRRGHQQQLIEAGRFSIQRNFTIAPANNTNLGATFRMEYADAELDNQSENALEFRVSDGGGWTKLPASSRNSTANYVELQNLNSFGQITLADDGAGLPVEFILFTVECRNSETLVSWATASEQNSSHFEVQSSANGTTWTTIATVTAAGNSNSEKRYSWTDQNPQGKFYRIKEVDLDGKFQYSITGVADCGGGNLFKVWPNPVQEQLYVSIKADRRGSAAIHVYNSKGQLVKKQNSGLLPGNNQLAVDMNNLATGLYHVEVIWNDGMRKAITVSKK